MEQKTGITLTKPVFYAIIICFFIVLCFCIKLYTDSSKERSDYMKDALIKKGKIEQLEIQIDEEKKYREKLILSRDSILASIKEKEKSKQVLKINYEKKSNDIIRLDADGSIGFLSDKLSE